MHHILNELYAHVPNVGLLAPLSRNIGCAIKPVCKAIILHRPNPSVRRASVSIHTYTIVPTHHAYEDGEGSDNLGKEPACGLDIFLLLEDRVVHLEPVFLFLGFGTRDVLLDFLLKFWTSSFLRGTVHTHTDFTLHAVCSHCRQYC